MFMQPQAIFGDWFQVDTQYNGIVSESVCHFTVAEFAAHYGVSKKSVEVIRHKWFARLSAPGYLDCTEWTGPFDSEDDAMAYLEDMYGEDA